jgi:hypothetical protein
MVSVVKGYGSVPPPPAASVNPPAYTGNGSLVPSLPPSSSPSSVKPSLMGGTNYGTTYSIGTGSSSGTSFRKVPSHEAPHVPVSVPVTSPIRGGAINTITSSLVSHSSSLDDIYNTEVSAILDNNQRILYNVFLAYYQGDKSETNKNLIKTSAMTQMFADFAIYPNLASLSDITSIYKVTLGSSYQTLMEFCDFCEIIVRLAILCLSKTAKNLEQFPTNADKVYTFLMSTGLNNQTQLKAIVDARR